MAKVSMHLGFTFRVGDLQTNQYGRIDVSVDQIDTDLPIDEQLDQTTDAAEQVWSFLRKQVDEKIDDILEGDNNGNFNFK